MRSELRVVSGGSQVVEQELDQATSIQRLLGTLLPAKVERAGAGQAGQVGQLIRVLVVDEAPAIHERVAVSVAGEPDIELVGGVASGEEALALIPKVGPDVMLISMDLAPEGGDAGMGGGAGVGGSAFGAAVGTWSGAGAGALKGDDGDAEDDGDERALGSGSQENPGVALAEAVAARFPGVSLIMTSRWGSAEQLRRAMLAGARQVLVLPFTDAELVESIRSVYRLDAARRTAQSTPSAVVTAPATAPAAAPATAPAAAPPPTRGAVPPTREGKVYTFYSAKGGAGCTTLACNTAVALKRVTGKEVAIFDCGLLFGDVGVVLNLDPRATIVDLVPRMQAHSGPLDPEFLSQMMVTHASGVKVMLAPSSPEKAELVTAEHVNRVLAALREQFDYVVIDTWPTFEERILHVLDAADKIVVPATLEMPAIKNCKLLLDVASALSYPPEKVVMVLNRADSRGGIRVQDVEQILQKQFAVEVVSDGRLTTVSLNEGVPFVMTQPEAPISKDVIRLAGALAGVSSVVNEARPRRGGLFRSVFGG